MVAVFPHGLHGAPDINRIGRLPQQQRRVEAGQLGQKRSRPVQAVGGIELQAGIAGLAAIGAGLGIGKIGGQAMDAMARQPEVMNKLFTNMIVAAALIEGVALFAAVIAFLCI